MAAGQQFIATCPKCVIQGINPPQPLVRNGLQTQCRGGHTFADSVELNDLMRSVKPPTQTVAIPQKPKAGEVAVQLILDQAKFKELQQRFGARLEATLVSLAGALLDPDAFVMSGLDVRLLAELTGEKVKTARGVHGLFDAQRRKMAEMEEQVSRAKQNVAQRQYGSVIGKEVTFVAVEEADVKYLEDKAKLLNKPVTKLVGEFMHQVAKCDAIKTK